MKGLSTCGCCSGVRLKTPLQIKNRPGLSSIAYRIGQHHDFKGSLLAKLSGSHIKSLLDLSTRTDNDFTIALLDSFSVMADVLTFYQERLANEAYLNTSKELLSVRELAWLIGYNRNPGVAASTYLSFTLDENSTRLGEDTVRNIKSTGNEKPIVNIPVGTKSQSIPEQDQDPQIFETIEEIQAKADWNAMAMKSFVKQKNILTADVIYVAGIENNIHKGDQIFLINKDTRDMKKVVKVELLKEWDITAIYFNNEIFISIYMPIYQSYALSNYYIAPVTLNMRTVGTILSETTTSNKVSTTELQSAFAIQNWNKYEFKTAVNSYKAPVSDETKVYIFRNKASLFGYNAPPKITNIDSNGNVTTIEYTTSEESQNYLTLDAEYPEVTSGEDSYIALKRGSGIYEFYQINTAELLSQSKYGISAKSTKLGVSGLSWSSSFSQISNSMAYIQSERLEIAQVPITEPVEKGSSEISLNRYYVDLHAGQRILVSGEITDLPGVTRAEIHKIKEVSLVDQVSQIITESALENSYIRNTVKINANVALASHGETVNEILGSGNSAIPFQKFRLKHTPLTYLSDDSSTGSSSTIKITVNDIEWKEVPHLYRQSKDARVYTISHNDDNSTLIIFGDGKSGARLPTGNLNVRATYRKGIGSSGLLNSNQITQLLSRPNYLKTVNNPLAPEGAQDAEQTEDIRQNANLSIFTLERIVSLKDYEDFARAFSGVEKARAVWIWGDNGKIIHLTIAGANGMEIEPNSKLRSDLISALSRYSHPGVTVEIDSYVRKFFQVKGNLKVLENYDFKIVHQQIEDLLKANYAFKNRQIGEHIFLSRIIADIESIEGVEYVDIDKLFITGSEAKLNNQLTAQFLKSNAKEFRASELLELDPNPLKFSKL